MAQHAPRGLDAAAAEFRRLPEIDPVETGESLAGLLVDIQATLGTPSLNLIFRLLANEPEYLDAAWTALRPLLVGRQFSQAVGLLHQARPPLPPHPGVDFAAFGDLPAVRSVTAETLDSVPKLLVIATALHQSMPGRRLELRDALAHSPPAGYGRHTGPGHDDPAALLRDIQLVHGHPVPASFYRSLAAWPDLLGALWRQLRPWVTSAAFLEGKRTITDRALALATELGLIGAVQSRWRQQHLLRLTSPQLEGLLAVFRYRYTPDVYLTASAIRDLTGDRRA